MVKSVRFIPGNVSDVRTIESVPDALSMAEFRELLKGRGSRSASASKLKRRRYKADRELVEYRRDRIRGFERAVGNELASRYTARNKATMARMSGDACKQAQKAIAAARERGVEVHAQWRAIAKSCHLLPGKKKW